MVSKNLEMVRENRCEKHYSCCILYFTDVHISSSAQVDLYRHETCERVEVFFQQIRLPFGIY